MKIAFIQVFPLNAVVVRLINDPAQPLSLALSKLNAQKTIELSRPEHGD